MVALAFGGALFFGCRTVCTNWDEPSRLRVIELAPGVTRLENPLVLGPEDSGTVIRGAADGSSVLSGAVELKGLAFERASAIPSGARNWSSSATPQTTIPSWRARSTA